MHSTNTTKVGASVPENFELTLVKNERRADTRLLAKHLGNRHKNVFELVKNYRADFEQFGILRFQTEEIEGRGQPEKFTSEFGRGKLQDLVALLSGRNFETKAYEDAIAEDSFQKLKSGILAFINETHFDRITMILRSAGFITSDLISSQNAVNFAYIVYLRGRKEQVPAAELEQLVRRWYAMSVLRGRYSGSPESQFDFDIRQIDSRGVKDYVNSVIPNELPARLLRLHRD